MSIRIDGTNTTANPGITGSDTDTGLQFGTNEVKIVTGGSARATVDSSGRLLVGTTTSTGSHVLEVNGGTDNEVIKVESSDAGAYIRFEDDDTTGQTRLGAVDNDFKIDVNSSERLRINSSGVGIDETSPTAKLHISDSTDGGLGDTRAAIRFSRRNGGSNDAILYTVHNGADGVMALRLDVEGGERLRFTNNGLTFNGDTASANALDDYEEGTWTPTLNKSSGDGAVSSPTNTYGYYRKVGNLLFLSFYWYKNSGSFGSNSGVWYISGVPFSLKTQANSAYQSISGGYFGFNGTDYFTDGSHRWQAHNLDGNQTLSVYGPQRTTNWSSGYMEVSGSGVLMVL